MSRTTTFLIALATLALPLRGVALAQCKSGDIASTSPVVERELTHAMFTLPPRS